VHSESEKGKVDPITLGLINNFLYSLVDEMTLTVVRTSFSPITRDAFDFQCGLCNAKGEMLMEGEGALAHSGVYPPLINNWIHAHKKDIKRGDLIIANDPYSGASHLPDVYLWHPVFIGDELAAWTVGGGHLRDVGGSMPGSCASDSKEIFEEGLRIPPLKLYDGGVLNETLYQIIRYNSRTPDVTMGDIEAYRAACYIGEMRFSELVRKYDWGYLARYLDELLNYSERLVRAEIEDMPDGEYEFEDYLDDDGYTLEPVRISVKITVAGDNITYDFTGTSQQRLGAMNNPYSTSRTTVITCLREMVDPTIPRNSGAWRPVKLIIPEGTLLNPRIPGACAARGATVGRQMDAILGAQSKIRPEKMMACSSEADVLINVAGKDMNNKYFIFMETFWGGWGGRHCCDGVDYNTIPFMNGGNQPCELNEQDFPVMYNKYGYVPDTEGAGTYRGSLAVVREIQLLCKEATLQLRADRERFPPYGLFGGLNGAPLDVIINPDTDNHHTGKTNMNLKYGDVTRLISSGAGGWGNPLERDLELVRNDVLNGKVSIQRAKNIYGVIINEATLEVDSTKTYDLRSKMKQASA